MNRIGILRHPKIAEAEPLADQICAWLQEKGVDAWVEVTWETADVKNQLAETDMLIVLGGDGSLLRAARLGMPYRIPVLGINMGRVGFLTEAQLDDWQVRLERVLQGDYWLEKRLMAHATLWRDGRSLNQFIALNDVVMGRGAQARVLRLELCVDGDVVTTYTADALIVATPTGSTAYSMAAGGPLLPPQLQNFVVVPVAAHLSLDRALVLHEEAEISIRVEMDHEAMLTADGQQVVSLVDGDRVIITKHDEHATFVRVDNAGYFYRRLLQRLGFLRG
jgi:NAD+ kinase